jgi:outer membrane protein TolC
VIEMETAIRSVVTTLKRRYRMLQQMESGLLDLAQESWQIAQAAYEEGSTELLRLLDAHRSLMEARLLLNRNQIELQIDLVDLETAVGEPNLPVGLGLLSFGDNVE